MSNNLQIVSIITVIKNKKNQYLLVQRSKNDEIFPLKWQNLGGKVELGEKLEDTIKREVEEEVGIELPETIDPIFLMSYSWKKDKASDFRLGVIFLIEINKDLKIKICEELNNYGWFTVNELKKLDTIGKDSPTGTMGQIKRAEDIKMIKAK